jgi:hypothetical protein
MSNGTMKVKSWGHNQGDFVVIDKENFDPEFHTEYVDPSAAPAAKVADAAAKTAKVDPKHK